MRLGCRERERERDALKGNSLSIQSEVRWSTSEVVYQGEEPLYSPRAYKIFQTE